MARPVGKFKNILRQAKRAKLVTALRASCFLQKHSCVPSVASDFVDYRTSCFMFSSKTFRMRRSLENVLFSESSSILVSLMARQVNRHEKLFEHSEFFEWLRKSDFRPLSSGRFCTFLLFLFISVTKEKKIPCRACPAYKKTINLWINFVNSKKSFTFAHNLLQR